MESQVFSIRMRIDIYRQLKNEIGRGKVSKFIESLVARELNSWEQNLTQEYQEAYQNPRLTKLAKKWEKAEVKSWLNYEKNKK